jgi:hypothetical protein
MTALVIILLLIAFLLLVGRPWYEQKPQSSADGRKNLDEKQATVTAKYRNMMRLEHCDIQSYASTCLREVIISEGVACWKFAPKPGEILSSWERRPEIPREYKVMKHVIERSLVGRVEELKAERNRQEDEIKKRDNEATEIQKQAALEEIRKAQQYEDERRILVDAAIANESKEVQLLYEGSTGLIQKFLEVAERRVSILDEYGDENWEALDREVEICLVKIAQQNGVDIRWQTHIASLRRGGTGLLPDSYLLLWERLADDFRKYHKNRGSEVSSVDVTGISGVDFEAFIARRLKENGYEDVRGTPATGDQGADLIAKKNGRTIIIQAKRYHGTVGNKAVQEVNGAVSFYGGDEAWVITNSTYTSSARALAQKTNVRLFDGRDLERLDDILRNS